MLPVLGARRIVLLHREEPTWVWAAVAAAGYERTSALPALPIPWRTVG